MKPYRMDELGFECPPLPWRDTDLEPVISAEAVRLHYGLHAAYCERAKRLYDWQDARDRTGGAGLAKSAADAARRTGRPPSLETIAAAEDTTYSFPSLEFLAAQAWNHAFQWLCFRRDGPRTKPATPEVALRGTPLGDALGALGTTLEEALLEAAGQFVGSGWLWLSASPGGEVVVDVLAVAGNPLQRGLRPLFVVDLWEHAFLLDYDGDRADYVKRVVRELADWRFIADRYDGRA